LVDPAPPPNLVPDKGEHPKRNATKPSANVQSESASPKVDIQRLIEQAKKANTSNKAELDQDETQQVDTNADRNLEQMIEKQSKEIEMQQMKEQKKAQAEGKLKISKAALALNNLEMGLEKENKQEGDDMVGVSADQLYTNFGQTDSKTIKNMTE
jgi:rubrerythrin